MSKTQTYTAPSYTVLDQNFNEVGKFTAPLIFSLRWMQHQATRSQARYLVAEVPGLRRREARSLARREVARDLARGRAASELFVPKYATVIAAEQIPARREYVQRARLLRMHAETLHNAYAGAVNALYEAGLDFELLTAWHWQAGQHHAAAFGIGREACQRKAKRQQCRLR
jgi:hypothetical protein